jgi:hypothetical protein
MDFLARQTIATAKMTILLDAGTLTSCENWLLGGLLQASIPSCRLSRSTNAKLASVSLDPRISPPSILPTTRWPIGKCPRYRVLASGQIVHSTRPKAPGHGLRLMPAGLITAIADQQPGVWQRSVEVPAAIARGDGPGRRGRPTVTRCQDAVSAAHVEASDSTRG